uniref:YhdP family protein n=1 Tax=Ningiella ruwaisensis TaxID=2364274 RepID=UPI0010A02ABA|nr:YhdP family protein [Ningiella ruwaisensis]
MSKASKYTTLILRKLWTLVAVLLVVVALLISLLRYSLPLLNDRKHVIEDYVNTEYGLELSIGEVKASWQSSGPSLQFSNVHLKQGDQSPLALEVGDVYLAIEFWASIFSAQLQSRNVSLSDLNATLDLQRIQSSSSEFPVVSALENLFLEQLDNFSVSNSAFTLVNQNAQNTIRIKQLTWLNADNRHQGLGELSLQGFASNTAIFVLDLYGNVDSYNGLLYAKGQALDISPWLNEFTQFDGDLVTSKGNFSLWADISQGRFTKVRGQITPSQFTWRSAKADGNTDDTENQTNETQLVADFAAQPFENEWHFAIKDLAISNNQILTTSDWTGCLDLAGQVNLNNTAPVDMSNILPLSALFSNSAAKLLDAINLKLLFDDLHVSFGLKGLNLVAEQASASWQEYENIPGVSQLNISAYWKENSGRFEFSSEDAVISANAVLERDLRVYNIDLPVFVQRLDDSWSVISDDGKLQIDALNIHPKFGFNSKNQMLSMLVDIDGLPLNQVPSLLPNEFMSAGAKNYLANAFIGEGEVQNAHLLWHGSAQDFPFENQSGIFQASVAVKDADFLFSDAWPMLRELDINLLFENDRLDMRAERGTLASVNLTDLRAEIPKLSRDATLSIHALGESNGEAVARLMQQSSLKDSLGRILSQDVIVSGPVSTNLGLYIPLSNPGSTRAVGEANLLQSQVTIAALGLDIQNAKGKISFDNEALSIEGLNAELMGQSVALDLVGSQKAQNYELDIALSGDWSMAPLFTQYAVGMEQYVQGNAEWILDIDVSLREKDYFYTAALNSDLMQVTSSLPPPFNKAVEDKLPLFVEASGNNIASTVNASLGRDISFEGVLPHKEKQFSRAHLALGQTDFVGMGVGFSISANLPYVEAQKWMSVVKLLVGDTEKSSSSVFSAPERVFAQADQVIFAGARVTDANVTAKQLDGEWELDIDSDQMRGNVDISKQWISKGISIDADYIKLADVDFEKEKTAIERQFDPKKLPRIDFSCRDCEFGDFHLGRVSLEAVPNDDGLEISRLKVEADGGSVSASGQWYQRHSDHYTFLAGNLQSSDFGTFLDSLGLDSGIQDSGANMEFALTWKDSPIDFGFKQLDGHIDWSLSDGYLTEVSDKGSRIFTLLSLNSLVRKLSLDFRDVFAKGFFYDDMRGSVQITDGKADTRDTKIDGAAGEIEIYGYTDLVSQQLNYNVSFTPNVTGNLPVLVYFFTVSPPSALAALALDQVLTSAKVISNVNYSVTGTISEPVLIETGRESTEVALPTRRIPEESEMVDEFIPPTVDDLLPLEQNDG